MDMIRTIIADGRTEYEALQRLAGRGDGDAAENDDTEKIVRKIIEDVRDTGDDALIRYSRKFDSAPDGSLAPIDRDGMKAAYDSIDSKLTGALERAAENIREYHEMQVADGYEKTDERGCTIGQTIRGLEAVGIYVPGGTASYPSTVMMNAIPAKLAGVGEIIMASPPPVSETVLAAAYIAGVDRIYQMGGAQAIAALAYGTETIPKVDKIIGPGNKYVAAAKRMVFGQVDIDMIAGPSEILILADEAADAAFTAADMLSQAEHDSMSSSVLLTTSAELAEKVYKELQRQSGDLTRKDIAEAALKANGLIIICRSESEMIGLANEMAPEHVEIFVEEPLRLVPEIKNAGSIFCGPYSPEPLGDYYSGTNHVLPTAGTARWASPLGVYGFVKRTSYTSYTLAGLKDAAVDICTIAGAEGLDAHAAAVKKRIDGND